MLVSGIAFVVVMAIAVGGCWAMDRAGGRPRAQTATGDGDLIDPSMLVATTLTLSAADDACVGLDSLSAGGDCSPQQ